MNEQKREKILSKLKKLMDLKESAKQLGNEGEANAAAAGISRLLIEYNLNEEDIPTEDRLENPVVMENIPYECTGHRGKWYTMMVNTVCKNNLCECILRGVKARGKTTYNSFSIIGRRSNVEVSMYLISYLNAQFQFMGRVKYIELCNYWKTLGMRKQVSKQQYMTSFLYGCVDGLRNQYDELKRNMESEIVGTTALVATTRHEIERFISANIGNITYSAGRKFRVQASAYQSGVKAGSEINLQSGLNGRTRPTKSIR